jgi:hypothetical protein
MTLIDILETSKDQYEKMQKVFQTFSGKEREWSIKTPSFYSQRFKVSSFEELVGIAKVYSSGKPHEFHMSVQQFRGEETVDWTFIIDVDGQSEEEKKQHINKLKKVLDKFDIFYLMDNHHHLWFPEWEHVLVENWNMLREDDLFADALTTYLEKVAKLDHGVLDSMLWKSHRHLIRMPYSPHLSGGFQQFAEEFENSLKLWTGEQLDKTEYNTAYYAENFKKFIDVAIEKGKELLLLEIPFEPDYDSDIRNTEWIEKLLQTTVPKGYRGKFLWLIITPYLVNVRNFSIDEATNIANNWLKLCGASKYTDKDLYNYVPGTYKHFLKKGIKPYSLQRLRINHKDMYQILLEKGVVVENCRI